METELLFNKKMLKEVLNGLNQNPKTLPCKYFYDEKGSELFEQICKLDEYHLTRTEIEIMKNHSSEMARIIGENSLIIELGCGNSNKIKLLLDHLESTAVYIPIDISENTLKNFVDALQTNYPKLKIVPICTDFSREFNIPELNISYSKKIVYFPGSTINNIGHDYRYKLLKHIRATCGQNGGLLIGVDLKKNKAVLEAAYNDKKGITAKFNLNILNHINNQLNSDFNVNNFRHKAIYNEKESQIEMYLISKCKQEVKINDEIIYFDENESILTEISRKYDINEFKEWVSDFFEVQKIWADKEIKFAVFFLSAK